MTTGRLLGIDRVSGKRKGDKMGTRTHGQEACALLAQLCERGEELAAPHHLALMDAFNDLVELVGGPQGPDAATLCSLSELTSEVTRALERAAETSDPGSAIRLLTVRSIVEQCRVAK